MELEDRVIEIILQNKCVNKEKQQTAYIKNKCEQLQQTTSKEFGQNARLVQSSVKPSKFALQLLESVFWNWVDNLMTQIYENPEKNIPRAKQLLKMIKPTYQYIGLRKHMTLLGFLLQLHTEYPHVRKFKDVNAILNPESVKHLAAMYSEACPTGGTDTWGTTRFQTWRIVCGMIDLIVQLRPELNRRDLLELATKTSVQSPVAEGKAKALEVIGAKNQRTGPFREFAKEWGLDSCKEPSTAEKVYKWTNPQPFDDQIRLDLCAPHDDDMSQDENENDLDCEMIDCRIPSNSSVEQPSSHFEENYLASIPPILKLFFEECGRSDSVDTPILSNAQVRSLAEGYLKQKNKDYEGGEEMNTSPDLFFGINGFDDDTVMETFGVCTYDELSVLFHSQDPRYACQFNDLARKFNVVVQEWSNYSILSLQRGLGFMNVVLRQSTIEEMPPAEEPVSHDSYNPYEEYRQTPSYPETQDYLDGGVATNYDLPPQLPGGHSFCEYDAELDETPPVPESDGQRYGFAPMDVLQQPAYLTCYQQPQFGEHPPPRVLSHVMPQQQAYGLLDDRLQTDTSQQWAADCSPHMIPQVESGLGMSSVSWPQLDGLPPVDSLALGPIPGYVVSSVFAQPAMDPVPNSHSPATMYQPPLGYSEMAMISYSHDSGEPGQVQWPENQIWSHWNAGSM